MELEAFYYAFALPVGVIMVFNFALFTVIMSSLMRRPMAGLRNTKNKHSVAETNIKAAFTIFVLLGETFRTRCHPFPNYYFCTVSIVI